MKKLLLILCCCFALSACGKGSSTSNLPQVCQDAFSTWESYATQLERDTSIRRDYFRYEQDSLKNERAFFASASTNDLSKLTDTCKVYLEHYREMTISLNGDRAAINEAIADLERLGRFKPYK